jgi:Phage tail tube protein
MGATTNRIAGVAYFSVDGVRFPLVGDLTYDPGTVKRKSEAGQDVVHGYSEEPYAPSIQASLRDTGGYSVAAINAMTGVTVVAELANGKTIIGSAMWTVESQEVETADAKYKVRFEGLTGAVVEA